MPGPRALRILGLLAAGGVDEATSKLCGVAAEALSMSGAGIMLMSGELRAGSVCSSNRVSALIEDLQYTLGEGPCVDAHREQRPVLEPDLGHPAQVRWLAFSPPALAAGARAVFGFPMRVGSVRLGALNIYRDQPGALTDDQHADALVMSDIAAREVLAVQSRAPAGAVAEELESTADLRYVVYQATGVVAAQLGVSVTMALLELRSYAFAHDELLNKVAEEVVSRRLRFDRQA